MTRCPIFPNHNIRKDGTCTRFYMCPEESTKICKARPLGTRKTLPYSKKKTSGCQHKYTDTVPTSDKVIIDGQEKKVFEVVCRECGYTRRMIL